MRFRVVSNGETGDWYSALGNASEGWKLPYWAAGANVDTIELRMGHHFKVGTVIKMSNGTITIIGKSETAKGSRNTATVWPARREWLDDDGEVEAVSFSFYTEEGLGSFIKEEE